MRHLASAAEESGTNLGIWQESHLFYLIRYIYSRVGRMLSFHIQLLSLHPFLDFQAFDDAVVVAAAVAVVSGSVGRGAGKKAPV